jgi:hypothetical protein
MVNKTTSFKKGARERRGTSRRMAKQLLLPRRNPRLNPNPRLRAPIAREKSRRAELPQNNWQIKRLAMSTKIYLIYMLLICTLLVLVGAPGYFDTGSVACNLKHGALE